MAYTSMLSFVDISWAWGYWDLQDLCESQLDGDYGDYGDNGDIIIKFYGQLNISDP